MGTSHCQILVGAGLCLVPLLSDREEDLVLVRVDPHARVVIVPLNHHAGVFAPSVRWWRLALGFMVDRGATGEAQCESE